MSKIILGLDLGITSIGWALVNTADEDTEKNKIIDSGVRIFTIAEHPKDGKSLALPRREARSVRRTTKRKAQRMRSIKQHLIKTKIIGNDELENLFIGNKKQIDVWELRKKALYQLLNNKELARVMIHIAKHRGYASNRKSDEPAEGDKEGKAVLSGISANAKILESKEYLTVGEYISSKTKKRNGRGDYTNSIARSMSADEIKNIFEKQKNLGSQLVSDDILKRYCELAFTQRSLKSVEDMVAKCPFERDEFRAAQATYTFERFRALQKLKNIRLIDEITERSLSKNEMNTAIEKAMQTNTFTYKTLKSTLDIPKETHIKGLVYFDHKSGEKAKDPETTKMLNFSAYQKIKIAIEAVDVAYWSEIKNKCEIMDAITTILSTQKDDKIAMPMLNNIVKDEVIAAALLSVSFSKFGHLSVKAMMKIIPYLEDGLDYDKACTNAGYDFKAIFQGEKTLYLPPLSKQENLEMTNPVVKRAVAQMRLVYNAIARKHGEIDAVHVEFTREIKKSHKDRNDITKAQGEFRDLKEAARQNATEVLGKEPSAKELLKFRLWKEQNGCCIYSGNYINPGELSDPFATEIDHILPYSRSLEDALNNKVLCLTKENQNKGNQTPYEWFGEDAKAWEEFSGRVNGLKNLKMAKKSRLLKINFDTNSENAFKERNKNDTSYISKFVKNYIEAHIAFKNSSMKRHVFTMNGMLTTQLRYKWGVADKNRDTHLHHAEDALILAFCTPGQVQRLSTVSAQREQFIYKSKEEKAKQLRFKAPLENFHEAVQESVTNIFVSHMPRRKISGAAHEETIYSPITLSTHKADGTVEYLKGNSAKNNVKLPHGLAKNDSMPRVDIFQHKTTKKYYVVPLYVSDFVQPTLPNKAIVQGNKPWIEMDEAYEFQFTFYKNDLIEIKTKKTATKESAQLLGYFDGAHSGTANIIFKAQDGRQSHSLGIQNAVFVKKYNVDPLGEYVEVKNEKRQGSIKENWTAKLKKRQKKRQETRQVKKHQALV